MPAMEYVKAFKPYFPEHRRKRLFELFEGILDSGMFVNRDVARELEKKIAKISGKKYCQVTINGTTACEILLAYYRIVKRKRVVYVTPFFFPSIYIVMKRLGYKVKLVDVREEVYYMDVDDLKKQYDEDGVIMLQEISGYSYPELAKEIREEFPDAEIIHDAHFAFGAIETENDYFTSFCPVSLISGADCGAILTDDEELYEFTRHAVEMGTVGRRFHGYGSNYKLNEFSAAVVLSGVEIYDEIVERMQKRWKWYQEAGLDGLYVPDVEYNFTGFIPIYRIRCGLDQKAFRMWLLEDYGVEIISPVALYVPDEPIFVDDRRRLHNAEKMKEFINLPIYAEMKREDVEYVAKAIEAVERRVLYNDDSVDRGLFAKWRLEV